jgi:hypothetical protein
VFSSVFDCVFRARSVSCLDWTTVWPREVVPVTYPYDPETACIPLE